MNDWLVELLKEYGPFLVRIAGLLIVLLAAPLLALAWWRRVYPHTPLLVALAVPCVLSLALLIEPRLLPVIAIIDVAIPIVALVDLFTLPRKKSFAIERETTRVVSVQKAHRVTLHVSNLSFRGRTAWIRDDIPQEFEPQPKEFVLRLGPRSRTTVTYDLKASRRGEFQLRQVNLRVRSLFGLWQQFLAYPQTTALHVYPDMRQLAEYAILARTNRLSLMGVRRTRRIGLENDFERLRDYTLDDNYKYIDWKASARRLKLTVKDFQTSQSQRIIFLLDCGRLMTNEAAGLSLLDHALNAALLLSYVALRQGDSVGMIAFADRVLSYVPPRGGMKQMNQLLHASFNRFPELIESRYDEAFLYLNTHCKKRSLVVMISNVIDEVNAHQVESYLRNLVGRHLPLGVILRDHRLFDAADREPAGDEQLYQAAAAAEILTWRHQVLSDLEHHGVLALDVFPEDMTAPLVNRYLEIKARHFFSPSAHRISARRTIGTGEINMTMLIHVTTDNHIQGREPLVREVEASLQGSLARFAPQITRVEVHLSDENGKKAGDDDKKCTLEARLAGLQSLAVSGNGANLDQAVSSAVDKLAHMLDHKLGKLGDRKGRTSYAGEADGQP